MGIHHVVGLPLLEVRGRVNGFVAPYLVLDRGIVRHVFGIKVDDFVYPVDVGPFEDVVIESILEYDEKFADIECDDGVEFDGDVDLFSVSSESVDFGTTYDEELWAYVYALSDTVGALGFSRKLFEFVNYSRFYPKDFGGNYVVRLGPAVFLRVDEHAGGSVVSLVFSARSPGVAYRSVWDVLVSGSRCKYFYPVHAVAERISRECNIRFFELPVVRI